VVEAVALLVMRIPMLHISEKRDSTLTLMSHVTLVNLTFQMKTKTFRSRVVVLQLKSLAGELVEAVALVVELVEAVAAEAVAMKTAEVAMKTGVKAPEARADLGSANKNTSRKRKLRRYPKSRSRSATKISKRFSAKKLSGPR
jgi:hypothetical protein